VARAQPGIFRVGRRLAQRAESAADWRSEVEHIQTGRRWTFNTLDELLGFLRRQAEGPDVLRPPAGE